MREDLSARLDVAASLAEPVRRSLYEYVAAATDAVTREAAAAALGIPPHTAKFHLDRLVADGLLDASYRRPEGRGGPGAGRPAKVYRRSALELDVTVPERRYALAGRLLLEAIGETDAEDAAAVRRVLRTVARRAGRDAGTARSSEHPVADETSAVLATLRADGFEPYEHDGSILLRNCPFHDLAQQDTELVCGMNVAYVGGVLQGLGVTSRRATLDPRPQHCCVRVTPRHDATQRRRIARRASWPV
jgi:predicted ArsR family transcriptional regulator